MANIKIHKILTPAEYQKVLFIRKAVFIEEQRIPESIEIDEFENVAHHFLIYLNKEIVGTGRMRIKDQYVKFERIAILKDARLLGLGKELMKFMMKYAKENFSQFTPFMYSQESAVGFYEKLGWSREGQLFLEANIPHQAMILKKIKLL